MKRQKSIGMEEALIKLLEQKAAEERRSVSSLVEILIELGMEARYTKHSSETGDKMKRQSHHLAYKPEVKEEEPEEDTHCDDCKGECDGFGYEVPPIVK